jgi:hypothetical protein
MLSRNVLTLSTRLDILSIQLNNTTMENPMITEGDKAWNVPHCEICGCVEGHACIECENDITSMECKDQDGLCERCMLALKQ